MVSDPPQIQHLNIKLYCTRPGETILPQVIPVFHRWIQQNNNVLDNELLIDVVDYRHVPAGPGVILVGHDAFYSIELGSENRIGLLYNRRTRTKGNNKESVASAIKSILQAKELLEKEEIWQTKLRFSTDEIKLRINDRYLAPNQRSVFDSLKDDIHQGLIEGLGVDTINLHYDKNSDSRRLFEVTATTIAAK